tara:strand:+ start:3625 stop:4407 length:783 start_codon:yes stop_codon:yes gene_type:complete
MEKMSFEEPIVVGRTIGALLYAWRLQRRCILLEPFLYHTLSEEFEDIDFTEFNVENGEELTQNLLFITGLTSLLIEGGNVAGFRPDDKKLITKGNRRITLDSDIEIFDAKNTGFNEVFDAFHWRSGQSHETTRINSDDNFCNRVLFYGSRRNGVNWRTKDFTSVSHLTDKEVLDPDYGQGMARIKTARMFKADGLKGDYAWANGDKKYYKSIKFDFAGREVLPRVEQKLTLKEVCEMKQVEGEPWKMWKRLISREKTWLG